jgi:hypothetical protein
MAKVIKFQAKTSTNSKTAIAWGIGLVDALYGLRMLHAHLSRSFARRGAAEVARTGRIEFRRRSKRLSACSPSLRKEMAKQLSRAELYALVWSEPMKTLSERFGISDVALKKTCMRAEIPRRTVDIGRKRRSGRARCKSRFPLVRRA